MTPDDHDPLLERLSRLPLATPSAVSTTRGRLRAQAVLARKRQTGRDVCIGVRPMRVVDVALYVAGFAYLAGAVAALG